MNGERIAYLRLNAIVSAVYSFFINGMVAALIYHKADHVPTDMVSIAIDLTLTCLLTFSASVPFSRAGLRRNKAEGTLPTATRAARLLAYLYRRPALLGVSFGLMTALILFALTAPLLSLLGVTAMPFYLYIVLKCPFAAVLGALTSCVLLYAGMCQNKKT